jgi:Haem-degrading
VFFPGALPLYKNGVLVGGLGVSGDGVDQDDFVTSAGAAGFDAPSNIHADQIIDEDVRLPYLKFPQNPTY